MFESHNIRLIQWSVYSDLTHQLHTSDYTHFLFTFYFALLLVNDALGTTFAANSFLVSN